MISCPMWLDTIKYAISQVISRCGVPIFFLISSILFFKKKRAYVPTIKEKAKTLLIPYLFWNVAWIFIFFVLQSLPFTADYFSGNHLIKDNNLIGWLNLFGIGSGGPMDYPLWFVRDLMVVTLFFPLTDFITQKIPKISLTISIILLLIPIDFPFKAAVLWTLIGACMVKLSVRINAVDTMSMPVISLLYVAAVITSTLLHVFDMEFAPILTVSIFLGIIFWAKVTKYIYDCNLLKTKFLKLSQYTFIIFAAHEMTLSCIKKVCFKVLPNSSVITLVLYFIIPFAVITLCILLGKIMKRFTPALYAAVTGGRI